MSIRKSVSTIIYNDHQCLIFKRHPSRYLGWGMIKGGIEKDETPVQAMIREIQEETGIIVQPSQVIPLDSTTAYYDPKRNCDVTVQWFVVWIKMEQKPTLLNECHEWTDAQWVNKEQALQLLTWQTEKEALLYMIKIMDTMIK